MKTFKDSEGDEWTVLFKNSSYSVLSTIIGPEKSGDSHYVMIVAKVWPHAFINTDEKDYDNKGLTLCIEGNTLSSEEECKSWAINTWENRETAEWYPWFVDSINKGLKKEAHKIVLTRH